MKFLFSKKMNLVCAILLGLVVLGHSSARAEDHVVSPAQMQNDVTAAASTRQQNEIQLKGLLSSPQAQRAMQSAHIQPNQAINAVSQLSDSDLAQLSARSQQAQKDFAAGKLSDHDLLVIIVIAVVLIALIAIVH